MKRIDSHMQCPSCHHSLKPIALGCETCDLRIEGNFHLNEFAQLSLADLHFLRVFVQSEGKIKLMEAALGLSYPTVRLKLTEFKNKIFKTPLVENIRFIPIVSGEEKSFIEDSAESKESDFNY